MSGLEQDKVAAFPGFPPLANGFDSATIILPVTDETFALDETVRIILRDVKDKLCEILIVTGPRTTPEARVMVDRLRKELSTLVVLHEQTLLYLGGALREAFDLARGSHVVLMASDGETDPALVKELITAAEQHPAAIIAASRWLQGGSFTGYGRLKLAFNRIFQAFFALLYGSRLTDMTYAYRIYPSKLLQSIRWDELRHSFLFEALVKPLRLGVEVIEIPATWKARSEGQSKNTFFGNFAYFRTGFKTRFAGRKSILKAKEWRP